MPANETTVVNIICDNPNCPGNTLDPHDRYNWVFITHETYGQPSEQNVYCSATCAGTISRVVMAPGPPIDAGPPIPE